MGSIRNNHPFHLELYNSLFFQENRRAMTVQIKRNLILRKLNQSKHHPKEVCMHDCAIAFLRQGPANAESFAL
jgi:hypothetical protein